MSCYNDRETLSTLRFGNRAKSIKNAVKQNAQRSAKELLGLLNVADGKIKGHTELIGLMQKRLKNLFDQPTDGDELDITAIKNQVCPIYTTKDLDILTIVLKGDGNSQKVAEEEKEEGGEGDQSSSNSPGKDLAMSAMDSGGGVPNQV